MIDELDKAIASFVNDPPGSDYQQGYLAALQEMRKIAWKEKADALRRDQQTKAHGTL